MSELAAQSVESWIESRQNYINTINLPCFERFCSLILYISSPYESIAFRAPKITKIKPRTRNHKNIQRFSLKKLNSSYK